MKSSLEKLFALVLLTAAMIGCGEPPETVDLLLTNARVIDGTGTIHDRATIAITGERIQAVTSDENRFKAATTIDVEGKTVLPGLINVHVHLRTRDVVDEQGMTEYLTHRLPAYLQEYLAHGVTTIKSAGDIAEPFIEVRERLARGELQGPRLFLVGPVLTAQGGHPAATLVKDMPWLRERHARELASEAEARTVVRELADLGVDAIKFVYHGSTDENKPYFFSPGLPIRKMSPQMMRAIIDESHQLQLRVTAHTNEVEDAIAVLEAGCDGIEHGVSRSRLPDQKLGDLLRESGAFYVPTLSLGGARGRWTSERWEATTANLKQLVDQGARIALGTDGNPASIGSGAATLKELELMVEAGMSPEQVIEAATRHAAEHLGQLDDLGTLEAGKLADLVIVNGDPLADITVMNNIEVVIQGGRVVVDNR